MLIRILISVFMSLLLFTIVDKYLNWSASSKTMHFQQLQIMASVCNCHELSVLFIDGQINNCCCRLRDFNHLVLPTMSEGQHLHRFSENSLSCLYARVSYWLFYGNYYTTAKKENHLVLVLFQYKRFLIIQLPILGCLY